MAQEPAFCRIGIGQVCITPPLPCEMAGYFHSRPATRVARDLYATAIAFEKEEQYVVMVSADLIAMTDEICQPAFTAAAQRLGIPVSSFMACATHTHTGPEIRREASFPVDLEYLQQLPKLIVQAVDQALDTLAESVLCYGATRAPGLAHNRLSRCVDGSEVFGKPADAAKIIGAAGPEDDSVQVVSIYTPEKQLRGVIVNFACHPDISGGGKAQAIDSDWPGEMSAYLSEVYGQPLPLLFLQGTAGDINHHDHRSQPPRWIPGGRSTLARGVAGAVLYAMEIAQPLTEIEIRSASRRIELPFYVRDKTLYDLVDRLKQKGDQATYFEKNLIERVEKWPNDGKVDAVDITAMRLGNLAIAALPGEVFTAWGLEIKRYSPATQTMVVELASSHNGLTGYKPTSDQALRGARAKGAYGALPTLSQRHCPAAGQMMIETVIALLYELWA